VTSVTNETIKVGRTTDLAIVRGGAGKPLLILHDELGYPGWMTWNEKLAQDHTLLIPLQPGFGQTPRIDWIMNYRDLAGFYSQAVREQRIEPVDVIGFSAGAFIAAEMIAADPKIFSRMVLVAPMGLKPAEGEILDFFALTIGRHLRGTVADPAGTPEFAKIYGGEMSPAQFEAFEDARAETARIGWEPYMHNPSLPHLLAGPKPPTLIIRGTKDNTVPQGCADAYLKAIAGSKAAKIEGAGHRPEIENSAEFERLVKQFLAA
jgi:pimeloyl-ACP methyl ester carboxylesterase